MVHHEMFSFPMSHIPPTDDCRSLKFKPQIEDSSLNGHVIKYYASESKDDCELKCYMEDYCMSINFGLRSEEGKHVCELSDSDHELHPDALKHRTGFLYTPTEVRSTLLP